MAYRVFIIVSMVVLPFCAGGAEAYIRRTGFLDAFAKYFWVLLMLCLLVLRKVMSARGTYFSVALLTIKQNIVTLYS